MCSCLLSLSCLNSRAYSYMQTWISNFITKHTSSIFFNEKTFILISSSSGWAVYSFLILFTHIFKIIHFQTFSHFFKSHIFVFYIHIHNRYILFNLYFFTTYASISSSRHFSIKFSKLILFAEQILAVLVI